MKKITQMLTGVSMLIIAGSVYANEPVKLTAAQMDGVNAGAVVLLQGVGIADALAGAIANVSGVTDTHTVVDAQPTLGFVIAGGASQASAFSVFNGGNIGGAQAASESAATSQLF